MNESGIYPAGNRVLVFADQIEEKIKDTVIELLPDTIRAQQSANASGTLIAVGPDAFRHTTHTTERLIDGQYKEVERKRSGYSEPFAVPGDRISYAKYAGQRYTGKDEKEYIVINDEDITCQLDPEVELSDLRVRERVDSK